MFANLLLLHERFTPEDQCMWKEGIKRGWAVERINQFNILDRINSQKWEKIRYYGNLLHLDQIKDKLPIKFEYIDPTWLPQMGEFTKRKIDLLEYKDLPQPIDEKQFIKPVNIKWFEAKVYEKNERVDGTPVFNDLIYVSEVVEFRDEIRCFVIDGKIHTCSYYRLDKKPWDLSEMEPDKLNGDSFIHLTIIPYMVEQIYKKWKMPRTIVADFGLCYDGEWKLVEFNEPHASGLYWCNWSKCFDVIIEGQINI